MTTRMNNTATVASTEITSYIAYDHALFGGHWVGEYWFSSANQDTQDRLSEKEEILSRYMNALVKTGLNDFYKGVGVSTLVAFVVMENGNVASILSGNRCFSLNLVTIENDMLVLSDVSIGGNFNTSRCRIFSRGNTNNRDTIRKLVCEYNTELNNDAMAGAPVDLGQRIARLYV